jgi:hypothetical protein
MCQPPAPMLQSVPCIQAEMWDVREYEYWDEGRGRWSPKQPAACTVRGAAKTEA